jgi:hypothetical protein
MEALAAGAPLDGVPAGAVGASTPLPPAASAVAERNSSWGPNVRAVGSDAELREVLVRAGSQTVRRSLPAGAATPRLSAVRAGDG